MGCPMTVTVPPVLLVIIERILNRVLLPAPFGPITPTISPLQSSRETPERATFLGFLYSFNKFLAEIKVWSLFMP